MELLQLRYFLESAQSENFSQTARRYRVPPSAVSMAVKRLERELGCPLFIRQGNRLMLNEQGRRLRQALAISLGTLDDAVESLRAAAREPAGEISLLIRTDRGVITRHIEEFRRQHPGVVFRIAHHFEGDEAGYDLIVDEAGDRYAGYESQPLLTETVRPAVAADSPLCGRRLTPLELAAQPFVTMGPGSSLRRLTVDCCRRAGFEPRVMIECDDPYYLRRYVARGFGVSLMPERSWKDELGENIAFLDVPELQVRRTACLYRRHPLGAAAAAFAAFLLAQEQPE